MWNNKYDEKGFCTSLDDVELQIWFQLFPARPPLTSCSAEKWSWQSTTMGQLLKGWQTSSMMSIAKVSFFWICHNKSFAIDYDQVDEQRTKINRQRVADAFFLYSFLDLNERWEKIFSLATQNSILYCSLKMGISSDLGRLGKGCRFCHFGPYVTLQVLIIIQKRGR